jgi:hypothetical protein
MSTCPHCGKSVGSDAAFCPACGAKLAAASPDEGSAKTLGILALVLGLLSSAILGVILGAIGLQEAKTPETRKLNLLGIWIPILVWALVYLVILIVVISGVATIA